MFMNCIELTVILIFLLWTIPLNNIFNIHTIYTGGHIKEIDVNTIPRDFLIMTNEPIRSCVLGYISVASQIKSFWISKWHFRLKHFQILIIRCAHFEISCISLLFRLQTRIWVNGFETDPPPKNYFLPVWTKPSSYVHSTCVYKC